MLPDIFMFYFLSLFTKPTMFIDSVISKLDKIQLDKNINNCYVMLPIICIRKNIKMLYMSGLKLFFLD